MGFLTLEGWSGVEFIALFVAIGTALGMTALYYLLIYDRLEKPKKRISVKSHLIKIFLLLTLLFFLWFST